MGAIPGRSSRSSAGGRIAEQLRCTGHRPQSRVECVAVSGADPLWMALQHPEGGLAQLRVRYREPSKNGLWGQRAAGPRRLVKQ